MPYNIDVNSTITSEQALENINKTVENLAQKSREFQEAKSQLAKEFKSQLDIIFHNFFSAVPSIKAISWSQYTPYHMDGDTCYFYIHEVYALSFVPSYPKAYYEDEEDFENESDFALSSYYVKKEDRLNEEEKIAVQNVLNIINSNDEFLEEVFGDHVIVCATAEGIEIEDYDDHN